MQIEPEMKTKLIISGIVLFSAILIFYMNISQFINQLEWWLVLILLIIISGFLYRSKTIDKKSVSLILSLYFIFSLASGFYLMPSTAIARSHGTVLSDNWFNALTWMRNNTDECAVVATYWDPGHFITGIARRAVVFDGASQNAKFTREADDPSLDGLVIKQYDSGISRAFSYEDGNMTTARIQDIATTLLTSNETLAVEILKEYVKPGCDELYYIASSDLISKSQWWTYFSTWSPTKVGNCPTRADPKGDCYFYNMIRLSSAKPQPSENSIIYTYPLAQNQAFLIYEMNNTMRPYLQQANMFLTVGKIFYFDSSGMGQVHIYPGSDVDGLIWVYPDKQLIMFIPPELESAMFTRMFLFNGQDLEHFEFVNNWGGEVKLFKLKLD